MLEKFNEFIKKYDLQNEKINQKYIHSIRVYELAKKYSKELKFNDYEQKVACIIGLLHDVGRFEQLHIYDSYNDLTTVDHADCSVDYLFNDLKIKKFWDEESDYETIAFAIKNHNKYEIEKTNNDRNLTHAKLIRDLDKLDILRWFDIKFINTQTNEPISKEVINQFENGDTIDKITIQNANDQLVTILAFMFDINNKELMPLFKIEYNNILPKLNDKFNKIKEIINIKLKEI